MRFLGRGGLGSAELMVGLDDFKGLFQLVPAHRLRGTFISGKAKQSEVVPDGKI